MEPITVEYLGSQIAETTYLNPKGTLTLCILTMKNGLHVVGESACLDPARFDAEVGRRIAYQNAFARLWQPYGFIRAEQAAMPQTVNVINPALAFAEMIGEQQRDSDSLLVAAIRLQQSA